MTDIDLDKCNLTIFSTPFIVGWFLLGAILCVSCAMSHGITLPDVSIDWNRIAFCAIGGAAITGAIFYHNEVR